MSPVRNLCSSQAEYLTSPQVGTWQSASWGIRELSANLDDCRLRIMMSFNSHWQVWHFLTMNIIKAANIYPHFVISGG